MGGEGKGRQEGREERVWEDKGIMGGEGRVRENRRKKETN